MFSQEYAPLAPIVSQKKQVQLSYPISVRSILISLRPARGSSKWSPFRLYYESLTWISLFHACHMHCPSFYCLFDRSNNISRRVQITRLQIMTFLQPVVPFWCPDIFYSHPVLEHSLRSSFGVRAGSMPIHDARKNYCTVCCNLYVLGSRR